MCAGDCQFFPSAPLLSRSESQKTAYIYHMWTLHIVSIYFSLLFITYQYSQKNSLYIWTSHTSYIFHIFLQLTFHLVQSHKKQPIYNIYGRHILSSYIFHIFLHLKITKTAYIYIFGHHILSQYIYILHISYHSHINILIFPPFSFRGTKKQPILTSHIFSLCFSHFLSYINFPSLLVQLYKRQPIYGGHIFLHPSHILLSHVSKFSPSLRSGSESKKTDGVQKNSQCVVHTMPKYYFKY